MKDDFFNNVKQIISKCDIKDSFYIDQMEDYLLYFNKRCNIEKDVHNILNSDSKITADGIYLYFENKFPQINNHVIKYVQDKIRKDYSIDNSKDKLVLQNKVLTLLCDSSPTKHESYLEAIEILVAYIKNVYSIKTIKQDESLEIWGYEDGIYINNGQSIIKEKLRDILGRAYSLRKYNDILSKITAETYIMPSKFFENNYPFLLPVKNGILNLNSLELEDFTPDKIFFTKLPINYNPKSKCKNIIKHLKSVLKDSSDLDLLQETIGNCLVKNYKFQKSVMMIGSGRNGKGVTLDLITRLLGPENCSGISLELFEKDKYSLADLHGKLANIAGDLSPTALRNTGVFKMATGEDLLHAPRKFRSCLNFVNYAKFFFACNELPIVNDNSTGFWERWLYFEFPYTFIDEEEYKNLKKKSGYKKSDPYIKDKLYTDKELEGFLNFAIEGLKRLINNERFSVSNTSEDIKIRWSRQSDSFKAFCLDNIEPTWDDDNYILKSDLRKKYTQYCQKNRLRCLNDTHIRNHLTMNFGVIDQRVKLSDEMRPRVWTGIKYKNN